MTQETLNEIAAMASVAPEVASAVLSAAAKIRGRNGGRMKSFRKRAAAIANGTLAGNCVPRDSFMGDSIDNRIA